MSYFNSPQTHPFMQPTPHHLSKSPAPTSIYNANNAGPISATSPRKKESTPTHIPGSPYYSSTAAYTSFGTYGTYGATKDASPTSPSKHVSYSSAMSPTKTTSRLIANGTGYTHSPHSYLYVDSSSSQYAVKPSTYSSNTYAYTDSPQRDPLSFKYKGTVDEKPKQASLGITLQRSNTDSLSLSPTSLPSSKDIYPSDTSALNRTSDPRVNALRMGYNGEVLVSSVIEKFSFDGRRASEFDINPKLVTGPILLGDKGQTDGNIYGSSTFAVNTTSQIRVETPRESTADMSDLDRKVLSILGKTAISTTHSPTRRPSIYGIANLDLGPNHKQTSYEGEQKDGIPNGKGKMTFADGRILEGEFFDGKADGFAKLYYENSGICYEGKYREDKFHGEGRLYNDQPKNLETTFDYKDFCDLGRYWVLYVGDFKDGKKSGIGTLYLSNGEKYYGEFNDDRIEGKGCYYYKGEVYGLAGEWKKNKLIEQF